jgi:hypothetical protein
MAAFAWILLFLSTSHVDLVDQVYEIPANEWRYVELALKQKPAVVSASYTVESGSKEVRLALLRSGDLDRLRDGSPHGVIEVTGSSGEGAIHHALANADDYVVVVDNRGATPSRIHLRVRLDFGGAPAAITQLSPRRKLTVILISFAAFFCVVTWSANRLLREIRK